MRYKGKYTEPEQYENIIIKAQNDGSILRLKDVAKVEFGAYSYGSSSKFDRKAGPMMAVFQMAGSNANEVQIAINEKNETAGEIFPSGSRIPYSVCYKRISGPIYQSGNIYTS